MVYTLFIVVRFTISSKTINQKSNVSIEPDDLIWKNKLLHTVTKTTSAKKVYYKVSQYTNDVLLVEERVK